MDDSIDESSDRVRLRDCAEHNESFAVVHLLGCRIISWLTVNQEESIYFEPSSTPCILPRGGVIPCFSFSPPRFVTPDGLGQIGHDKMWSRDPDPRLKYTPGRPIQETDPRQMLDLHLMTEDGFNSFELKVRICISPGRLLVVPRVINHGPKPIGFSFSINNNLAVSNFRNVRIDRLQNRLYENHSSMNSGVLLTDKNPITLDPIMHRKYLTTFQVDVVDTVKLMKYGFSKGGSKGGVKSFVIIRYPSQDEGMVRVDHSTTEPISLESGGMWSCFQVLTREYIGLEAHAESRGMWWWYD